MKKKYFGTDGIRGKVGKPPISADYVLKLGWAAGKVLRDKNNESSIGNGKIKVLIGKDTRISGYMFESALEAGFVASGVNIDLLGPMPTPAIAYLTRTLQAAAGIVISASHNKFYDNGIKFICNDGYKFSDEMELAIEKNLQEKIVTVDSSDLGKASRVVDAEGRYIEFCKSTFPTKTNLKGMKIVLDCANGATYHVAPFVFKELGAKVITIGVNPNGKNINEKCGSTCIDALANEVVKHQADLGIAFDGDGDRTLLVDHTGSVVDGDEILFIIAKWYKENGLLAKGVVGTQMSNLGLELALSKMNIPFYRSKVGDRYVLSKLKQETWNLGGESSGHIICLDLNTTGDGIVSALQVLAAIKKTSRTLFELKQEMFKFPQILTNIPINKNVQEILDDLDVKKMVSKIESTLGDNGRILLRASGTEPLIRIMVEGKDLKKIKLISNEIADVIRNKSMIKA